MLLHSVQNEIGQPEERRDEEGTEEEDLEYSDI